MGKKVLVIIGSRAQAIGLLLAQTDVLSNFDKILLVDKKSEEPAPSASSLVTCIQPNLIRVKSKFTGHVSKRKLLQKSGNQSRRKKGR
jgi:hypothetical protein